MPGICGILDTSGSFDVSARLGTMLQVLRHHDWYTEDKYVDARSGGASADEGDESQGAVALALGRVSLGYVNRARQPAVSADGSVVAVMEGELYGPQSPCDRLRALGRPAAPDSHAQILLEGYQAEGVAFFRELHGSFTAAIWDAGCRHLILVSDRFGMRPLYYAHLPGRLLFASSIKALTLDEGVSLEPNWRGLAQFFAFGQYFCHDTSLADVQIAPAAAWLVYDAQADRLAHDRYFHLAHDVPDHLPSEPALLDQLDAALGCAVERRLETAHQPGLALSGGLDARTILACVDIKQCDLQTISYGIQGSLDHRCSQRLADRAGCRHVNHVLDAGFLSAYREHLDTMVRMTDGQYLSQCIIMPTLPLYRRLGLTVLLRGHAGELMHMQKAYAYSLDGEALAIRDAAQLEAWLMRHLQAHMLSPVDRPLFRALSGDDVAELAHQSLREALREAEPIEPPLGRIWHLFVNQRLRRETALSLAKFGSVVEVRVPYLDNDLVRLLMATPPRLKLGAAIQAYILRRRMPTFLDVVNSNTGTCVEAGPLARRISTFRMKVLAKLGVPGYQPYERLGLWLRRELAGMVRDILLGEQALDRGIFQPDTVRRIVAQHQANKKNHTYLLMAMMIYELGQRHLAPGGLAAAGASLRVDSSKSSSV